MSSDKARSYRNTALIGLSSVINILLSVIRNKVFSIFLGPAGIGQFGILNDFFNSLTTIGSLGISNSGVQAISSKDGNDLKGISRIYFTLIRILTPLSVSLTLVVVLLAPAISHWLTGTENFSVYLRIASIVLIFRFRSVVQNALITGMKQIGLLAKGNVYQGLLNTFIGISLVLTLKLSAVPFLIISIALMGWLVSHFQSRRIVKTLPENVPLLSKGESWPILLLGISTLWSGLLESLVTLISKSWIAHNFNTEHLGYYQVAIGFTASYIGFITSSIITNYYPHLVEKVKEGKEAVNLYVNQQIGISMALIMPLLFIMLTFSKLFLRFLFSEKFLAANPLLNYTVAGTFIQVIAWPIAYVFLAKRATKTYFITESTGNGAMLILAWIAVQSGVFANMGLAYVLHYIIYLALITFLFLRYYEGQISTENIRLFLFNSVIIAGIILAKGYLADYQAYLVGSLLILFFLYRSRKEYLFMINTVLKRNNGENGNRN